MDNVWIEVRCPDCHRLLFKVRGMGSLIETVCPRCKLKLRWPKLRTDPVKET